MADLATTTEEWYPTLKIADRFCNAFMTSTFPSRVKAASISMPRLALATFPNKLIAEVLSPLKVDPELLASKYLNHFTYISSFYVKCNSHYLRPISTTQSQWQPDNQDNGQWKPDNQDNGQWEWKPPTTTTTETSFIETSQVAEPLSGDYKVVCCKY